MKLMKKKSIFIWAAVSCFLFANTTFAKARGNGMYQKRYSQRWEEIKNKVPDLRTGIKRGSHNSALVYSKRVYSRKFFKNKRLEVKIEKIEGRKILVDVYRDAGFIEVPKNALILGRRKSSIQLERIHTPCMAYIALGVSPDDELYIPYIQYIRPVRLRRSGPKPE